MSFHHFAARRTIIRVLGCRITTFYAEFKTGFYLATTMAAKHVIENLIPKSTMSLA